MATPRDFLTVHSIVSVHSILRVLCALKHENCINYDSAHAHKWFLFPRRNMRRTPVNQPKIDKYAVVSIIQDWQWCMKHRIKSYNPIFDTNMLAESTLTYVMKIKVIREGFVS